MMRYGEFKILSMSATLALIGFALIGSAECSTSVATRHLNLVQNGSFEVGIAPWTTQHRWFEYGGVGKGHGISKWQRTDEIARSGRYSLKVIGQNNRGIAIQDLQLPPIRYRVSGWIKCLNIERGEAQLLVEFIGAGNKWLCGQRIGGVRGTADWTFVSGEVECPEDAIILRVDLLTTEPNNGIAWFDDIIVAPAIRDEKPPVPVPFTCSGDGVSGLQLNWSKAKVERDVTLFHVFVETERFSNIAKLTPRAILPRWQRMWTIFGLPKRASYYVAIVPVDIFGNRVTEVEAVKVKCADRIPPHAPEFDVSPIWSRTPMAHLTWTPLPIDNDIASYRILARVNGKVHELKEIAQRNGLSCEAMVKLPDAEKPIEIAVIAIDSAGNESQANWKKVLPCTDARIGDTFINPYGLCEIAHVRIADDGGLELAPKDYDPAVLPGDLTKLLKSPEEIEYHASGYAITRPIILPPAKRSIHLQYDAHVPDGTTVRIDVLDATGNVLLENAPSDAQLNDDNVDSTIIRLKISLTTNDVHRTPRLHWWSLSWKFKSTHPPRGMVIDARSGMPISNATVDFARDGKHIKVRTDAHGRYQLPSSDIGTGIAIATAFAHGYVRSVPIYANIAGAGALPQFALYRKSDVPITIWGLDGITNVFRDMPPPMYAKAVVTFATARGEVECAQIVVRADANLPWVRLRMTALHTAARKRLVASAFEHRFVGYVYLPGNSRATPLSEVVRKAPDYFPDPLLDEPYLPIRRGVTQPIFAMVRVPRNTAPGDYHGTWWVETPYGALPVRASVHVANVEFPKRTRLWFTNWFSATDIAQWHKVQPWSAEHFAWLRVYARDMRMHHQNVVITPIGLVDAYRRHDGCLHFDFTRFDQFVEAFMSEGAMQRIELSHVGRRKTGRWQDPNMVPHRFYAVDELTGKRVEIPWQELLKAIYEHLRKRGWLSRAMIHIADEPIPINVDSWKRLSAAVRTVMPMVPRIDAIHVPNLKGYLEI